MTTAKAGLHRLYGTKELRETMSKIEVKEAREIRLFDNVLYFSLALGIILSLIVF